MIKILILITLILILILIISILFICSILLPKAIIPKIDSFLDIKKKETQNDEYKLYLDFDIESSKGLINQLVDDYIGNYVLYNFTSQDKEYIGQEDAEILIKEVTRTIVINLSDYYLFLFKMNRNISSDEDLVLAVRDIVKERALVYITESNKPT